MSPPRSETFLQVAGLVALAAIGVPGFLGSMQSPDSSTFSVLVVRTIGWAAFLVFGAAFFWNTRRILSTPPTRASVALLVLQLLICLFVGPTDLYYILAAEAPIVLGWPAAGAWIGIQATVSIGQGFFIARSGQFVPLEGLSHLPWHWVFALSMLSMVGWELFAFSAGYLASAEARGRRALARVHAELLATQNLLAESSRLSERLEISRELHDTLGHHLAALSVNLELASQIAEGKAAEPVRAARAVTRLLLSDVRDVVSLSRGERALDLPRAVRALAAGTESPRLHVDIPQGLSVRDPALAHALFRCTQEAITNAVRHSGARNVWIELGNGDEGVRLTVKDDGQGASQVRQGNGLKGMRERIEGSGGTLQIETQPGRGFCVIAHVPHRGGRS